MSDPCWTCSDNHMDDMVYSAIVYGGNTDAWVPQYNASVATLSLYPREGLRGITLCNAPGGSAELDFLGQSPCIHASLFVHPRLHRLLFPGQQVAVYGPEFNTITKSTYSIDGKVVYSRTAQGVGVGVRLFQSGVLSAGAHKLVIDVVDAGEDHLFALDWIEYNNTAREASQTATSSSTDPRPSSSQPQSPVSVASTSTASGASKAHVSGPVVAGGVVGGLVALVGIILTYMTLRSRRRWRMRKATEYPYGEVAQYGMYDLEFKTRMTLSALMVILLDSDTLAVLPPEMGPPPVIRITRAGGTASIPSIGSTGGAASSRNSVRARSMERSVEPGCLEQGVYSESPPAYTP